MKTKTLLVVISVALVGGYFLYKEKKKRDEQKISDDLKAKELAASVSPAPATDSVTAIPSLATPGFAAGSAITMDKDSLIMY